MAIESKIIADVNTENAQLSVRKLKQEISDLRDAWLNLDEGTEEYEQTTNDLVAAQEKLNQVMSVGKSQVSAATGSYNALVNQMNALKRVWRETTSEVQRQALGEKIRDINDQLKAYDETIGTHTRKVGAYEEALQVLNKQWDSQKQELSALKTALDNLDPSSQEYVQVFERAAEITHNLSERQEILRMSANDLGTQISNVANIGAGLVGGFNAIQGILTLTGQKSENLEKAMADLQAGIAIVQGLKGIEGMNKALKAYGNWAAKAFDRIVEMIAGHKAETKEIQATNAALEANAAANEQVAAGEANATAGATQLTIGMQGVDKATKTATASAVAWKAVIMTTVVGVAVAALTGLIKLLSNLANAGKIESEEAKNRIDNYLALVDEWNKKNETRHQRDMDMLKAKGKTEAELYEQEMKYHNDIIGRIQTEYDALLDVEEEVKKYKEENKNFSLFPYPGFRGDGPVNNNSAKQILKNAGFDAETLKKALSIDQKTAEKIADKPLQYLEQRIKKFAESTVVDMRFWDDELVKSFEKIQKNGIQTYNDLTAAAKIYSQLLYDFKQEYEFDPMSGITNDMKVMAQENEQAAADALKSEIQLEKDAYNEQLELARKAGLDTETLTRAHNKAVWDIITAHTQSIVDRAKASNQTELQNLEDTYNKELALLKQYGRDSTNLTKEYAKNRAKILLDQDTKAIEQAIKELERYAGSSGPMAQAYDRLEAAGSARAAELAKALADKQTEIFDKQQFSLSQQMQYWENLWNKIKDDEKITLEQRQSIYEKYLNAKMALENLETQHTLDQIKTRKQALDAEIDEIEKMYDKIGVMQAQINNADNDNGRFGRKGGEMTFGGFNQYMWNGGQQSYDTMRENADQTYSNEKSRLLLEIAEYQKAANDITRSEEERTAAKRRETEARAALDQAEYEHLKQTTELEKQEYQELINTITSVGDSISQIFGSIYDTIESALQYQVNAGKMSEDEMNKQLEKFRWIQYVQAIINTASGALGAFTQASSTIPPPYGQIVGAAAAASVVAQGVAQMAAIKAASKNSTLNTSSMQSVQMQPAQYEPEYNANLTAKSDTDYLRNALGEQKLFVSVTDINNVQSRVRTSEEESSF